jgi:hypothetical protein
MNKVILILLILTDKVVETAETAETGETEEKQTVEIPYSNIPAEVQSMIDSGMSVDHVLAHTSEYFKGHVEPSQIPNAGDGLYASINLKAGNFNY